MDQLYQKILTCFICSNMNRMAMSMLQSTLPYKEMNITPNRGVVDGSISIVDGFDLPLISGKIKV